MVHRRRRTTFTTSRVELELALSLGMPLALPLGLAEVSGLIGGYVRQGYIWRLLVLFAF